MSREREDRRATTTLGTISSLCTVTCIVPATINTLLSNIHNMMQQLTHIPMQALRSYFSTVTPCLPYVNCALPLPIPLQAYIHSIPACMMVLQTLPSSCSSYHLHPSATHPQHPLLMPVPPGPMTSATRRNSQVCDQTTK